MLLVFICHAIIDPHNIGGYRRLSEAIGGYSGSNRRLLGGYSGSNRGLLEGI